MVVAMLVAMHPAMGESADTASIELPAQKLARSLTAIGDVYGVTIVAPGALTQNKLGAAVSGEFTAMQVVSRVLDGSGLQARRSSGGVIVIEEKAGQANVAPVRRQSPSPKDVKTDVPDGVRLEEIVVRGEKLERPVFDTTSSVAVVDASTIRDLTLTDLTDVYRLTPNVNVDDSGEGTFSIRGISFLGVGFAGVSNTASLYVDEIFQSNLGIEAGPLSSFDVDTIEIFRGPQSTLQGRNALAGAVVVNTRVPTYEWDGKARVEIADYDTRRYAVAGGGPIVDDMLAFRVAVDYRETDGFIANPTLGRDDVDADETTNLRTKLLWEPADRFSALFTYIYSEGIAGTGFGTGSVEGPDFAAREVNYDNVTRLDIETNNFAATLDYDVSDSVRLEFVATYTDANEESAPRFPVDPATSTGSDIGSDSEEILTLDLRLMLERERLKLLTGLYYYDREQRRDRDLRALLTLGPFQTTINFLENGGSQTENGAVYLDGEYALTTRLSLLFGARYDREDYAVDSQSSTVFDPEIPPLAVSSEGGVLIADTRFNAFLPKLGLRYGLSDNQNLGFVVQRGYRPGGAGTNLANRNYEFGPEYLWNYELSYRSTWLGNRLQLNGNVYFMDWEDQQVSVSAGDGINAIVANAGESRLFGIEAELRWLANETWSFFAAAGYNDTEFTDFDAVDPLLTGNEFPISPEYQVSSGAIAQFESGLFLSIDASHTDGYFSDTANSPSPALPDVDNRNDAYTVVNAKLGYRTDSWTANVFARNLFDEDYTLRMNRGDFRSLGEGTATVGAPRVVGVELVVDF